MPRRRLRDAGGLVFHILNRGVRRQQIFFCAADYAAFERVLREALHRVPTRLLDYSLMPNHWHLVLWPEEAELPRFMHWLTLTHAKRWHEAHGSTGTGHVYQNCYRAVPVQTDVHLLTLLRYVERNPVRAHLVERAEDWRWGSLWRRCNFCEDVPLTEWPILQPRDWLRIVNEPQTARELAEIQAALKKGRPIGEPEWNSAMAERFGLRLRSGGRPRKPK
jgi:putative transposase